MGFARSKWAKCWQIEPGERSTKVRISTSKKNKQTNEYEQDFSGFVTLAGTAHKEAANLKVGDTFQIGDCEVTSRYDKEKKKEYINFAIYSFGSNEDKDKAAPAAKPATAPAAATDLDSDSEDLPF